MSPTGNTRVSTVSASSRRMPQVAIVGRDHSVKRVVAGSGPSIQHHGLALDLTCGDVIQ